MRELNAHSYNQIICFRETCVSNKFSERQSGNTFQHTARIREACIRKHANFRTDKADTHTYQHSARVCKMYICKYTRLKAIGWREQLTFPIERLQTVRIH